MNTNIENIRLKNGEEYPVSPAYFDGTIVPIEADFSSAERMTISIAMGGDPIEMDGVKVSDQVIPMETLKKYTWGKVNMSVPGVLEQSTETPMVQIFETLQEMMEWYYSQFAMLDVRSVPGFGGLLFPSYVTYVATDAGTFQDTLGVVTITIPSVGLYVITPTEIPSIGTLNGEMHFGEYHIPEGYLQTNRAVEELYPENYALNVEYSLFTNPILYSAFNRAYRAAKPIRLHMASGTQTYGDFFNNDKWEGRISYNGSQLCREVVQFTPKENMSVTTSVTSGTFSVEVDAEVYEEKTKGNLTELTFTFDGTDWTLDGNTVTLSGYGITLDGSPAEGDAFTAQLHGDSWKISSEVICTIPQA